MSGYTDSVMFSMLSSISEKLWSSHTMQRVTSGMTSEVNLLTRSCKVRKGVVKGVVYRPAEVKVQVDNTQYYTLYMNEEH